MAAALVYLYVLDGALIAAITDWFRESHQPLEW